MPPLPIRLFGDPVLRQRASEVTVFDDALRRLADDMLETLRGAEGAAIAANQVGVLLRLFVWELEGDQGALVNPVVLETSEETQDGEEGCLSFPGLFYPTLRPLRARLGGCTVAGEPVEEVGEGTRARMLLHELDHLNGILFIDHLARHDRKEAMRRIRDGELEHNANGGEPAVERAVSPEALRTSGGAL